MTERTPPKLATTILNHLVQNDALVGDLREVYVGGKSRGWYWRQVLAEIIVGIWRDCAERMWLAVGTVLSAVMLVSTADSITAHARGWLLYQVIQPAAWSHPLIAGHGFIVLWLMDVAPFAIAALLSGWIIGRFSRRHRGLMVLFSSTMFVGLSWRWSMVVVRIMFVTPTPRHLPMPYLLLFVVGQIVMPPLLALVSGLRSEATASVE